MYPKMVPEIKEKWVEALRYGDYKQGHFQLRDDRDNFCCLGVLCDVLNPAQWEEFEDRWVYIEMGAALPPEVVEQVNLKGDAERCLIKMNDKEKKTFKEIADWISTNL